MQAQARVQEQELVLGALPLALELVLEMEVVLELALPPCHPRVRSTRLGTTQEL